MTKRAAPKKKISGRLPATDSLADIVAAQKPHGTNPIKSKTGISTEELKSAFDAFSNMAARLGYGSSNLLEGTTYPLTRLTRNYVLMLSLFRTNWLARRICAGYPEDMCKAKPELVGSQSPKDEQQFERVVQASATWNKIQWTLTLANLFGGAAAIMVIDGHDKYLDEPLDLDDIKPGSYRGLIPFDRWSGVYPNPSLVTDINEPHDFGLPVSYQVTTQTGRTFNVHHSRIIRFIGRELPNWEKQAEMYWGASYLEAIFDELKKCDNASFNIASLMYRAQIVGLKLPQLAEMLSGASGATQQQERLWQTLQAQNALMSNQGMLVFPKDGGMETHQYSFGGIADVYEKFLMVLAGAAEYPFSRLFGRSAVGLGDTGEGDLQVYYDRVAGKQNTELRPQVNKLYPVIAMSTWGEVPDDFDYNFPSARTATNQEEADLAQKLNTPVIEAFNAGIIGRQTTLKELKQNSDRTKVFTNITPELIAKADDEVQEDMLSDVDPFAQGGAAEGAGGKQDEGKPGESKKPSQQSPKVRQPKVVSAQDAIPPGFRERVGTGRDVTETDPRYAPLGSRPGSEQGMDLYHGLQVFIESAKGSTRRGHDFTRIMPADYGYIADVEGADGDELDCYIGPSPESMMVYVVDQNHLDGTFDEHKVMLGYYTLESALEDYMLGHHRSKDVFRSVTQMSMPMFRRWMAMGDLSKPCAEDRAGVTVEAVH